MDITASTIETALRQLRKLPAPVSDWHVESGFDSTDDPAVWVWVTLKDDEVEFAKRWKLRSIIDDLVREKIGSFRLVYTRFRSASEMENEK